jgi:hypothetical protein
MKQQTEDRVRDLIQQAREALSSPFDPYDPNWTDERKANWSKALDDIEAVVDGQPIERPWSTVRSLDATAGVDGKLSSLFMSLTAALRKSGIECFR